MVNSCSSEAIKQILIYIIVLTQELRTTSHFCESQLKSHIFPFAFTNFQQADKKLC